MAITERDVDGVTVVEMDDGKANALSIPVIEEISAVLGAASRDARPVVIAGRPGMLCAGYDLETIKSGDPQRVSELLMAGRVMLRDVVSAPVPVIVACTGHAIAAGAMMLLVADLRFALDGPFRIGLTEVTIGMALPEFGVAVANHRLSPPHVTRAVAFGEVVGPEDARTFGFVDHVVDGDVVDAAISAAHSAAKIPTPAFATTKQRRNAGLLAALASAEDA